MCSISMIIRIATTIHIGRPRTGEIICSRQASSAASAGILAISARRAIILIEYDIITNSPSSKCPEIQQMLATSQAKSHYEDKTATYQSLRHLKNSVEDLRRSSNSLRILPSRCSAIRAICRCLRC